MTAAQLSKTKIETKLAIIREALVELDKIKKLSKTDFLADKIHFITSEHYLRRTLEAVFDIAGHILSRYPYSPGKRPITYKEIAIALAEKKVVEVDFAENVLVKMAGYRNRMIHHYSEITPEELFDIIQTKLEDIDVYAQKIAKIFDNPNIIGLEISDL